MWIELIQLRKAKENQELSQSLGNLIEFLQKIEGLKETHVLQHARYQSDLAIALVWETDCQREGSRQGAFLAEFLSDHGCVDHAIWIREPVRADSLATEYNMDGYPV